MLTTLPAAPNSNPTLLPAEPERHRQYGKLWSSLKEVFELLHIPAAPATEDIRFQHMQFRVRQRIHTIGQPFDMLYVVNSGFLKTVMIDELGNEQVLGFPMKGDMFGIDGIHRNKYPTETVALSNCDVIMIPFKVFAGLGRAYPELETSIYGVMSRELVREQAMIGTLGSLTAEARVARFLAFLSERYSGLGYSGTQFNLRMTRQEIGNYLGLTLETVSRTFSAFNTIGLISVDQRAVVIHDLQTLRTLRRLPPSHARAKMEATTAKRAERAAVVAVEAAISDSTGAGSRAKRPV